MTLEELNAILALPGTSVGKNGPTPSWGVANGIPQFGVQQTNPNKMDRLPFYDPKQPIIEANNTSGMEALGMTPDGRGINEPASDRPMNQPPAMAVDGTAARPATNEPVVEPAAHMPAPEFYGAESLMGGPTDITPQGYTDESKRKIGLDRPSPSMSKWDQFMSRPGMGNALLAMGGAMLSGKSPADAFGGGITAFNNTLENRRLNDLQQQGAEQDRLMRLMAARAKAKATGADPTKVNSFATGYDGEGNGVQVQRMQDGSIRHMLAGTNEWKPGLPEGFQDASTGMQKWVNRNTASAEEAALEEAIGASGRISQIDTMIESYDGAGAGPGWIAELKRQGAKIDPSIAAWFNIDVTDLNNLEQNIYDLNLKQAQTQRGLGQLTEGERALIAKSLPNIDTDREAFMTVMNTLKEAQLRAKKIYRMWDGMSAAERKDYGNDIRKFQLSYVEGLGESLGALGSSQGGGGSNTGTPAPNTSSVRSRADAILSGN